MKKIVFLLIIFISSSAYSSALLGGEITCRNINGLKYETTLTIYRDTISGYMPLSYTITYQDATDTIIASHIVNTPPGVLGPNGFKSYKYIDTIIFPFTGSFKASAWDCCRDSVDNISNANSYGMYIDCMVLADGNNSTPKFLSAPITLAQFNRPFSYNTTPYDSNGDSLSWELSIPYDASIDSANGNITILPLPYVLPPADSSFPINMDSLTGDITFKPNQTGKFQIVVKMKEWRNGQLIGYITRDMELLVIQSLNLPPTSNALITILPQVNNTNWVQGTQTPTINLSTVENLTIEFHAVDSSNFNGPWVFYYGSAFQNTSAYHYQSGSTYWYDGWFVWYPTLNNISNNPYFTTLRVADEYGWDTFYNDYTFRIFVSNTSTSVSEISSESKSVYIKSIDLLGREINPNLPGFRIDVYSDGKTRKMFRGE
jgi:hypothetical protein